MFKPREMYCWEEPVKFADLVPGNITHPVKACGLPLKDYLPDAKAFALPIPANDVAAAVCGIFRDPFDAAPRLALIDALEEYCERPEYLACLRDFEPNCYPDVQSITKAVRWQGPGRLGSYRHRVYNVWLGSWAQFQQACRSWLFIDHPITLVILADKQPFQDGKESFIWCDSNTILKNLYYNRYYTIHSLEYWHTHQHVINELCGRFMCLDDRFAKGDGSGVYRSNNRVCALLALSNALVNIGRYAVGLPILKFPNNGMVEYSTDYRIICPITTGGGSDWDRRFLDQVALWERPLINHGEPITYFPDWNQKPLKPFTLWQYATDPKSINLSA